MHRLAMYTNDELVVYIEHRTAYTTRVVNQQGRWMASTISDMSLQTDSGHRFPEDDDHAKMLQWFTGA